MKKIKSEKRYFGNFHQRFSQNNKQIRKIIQFSQIDQTTLIFIKVNHLTNFIF